MHGCDVVTVVRGLRGNVFVGGNARSAPFVVVFTRSDIVEGCF